MATIWDVAKLAGVSKSTVSRVMNNGSTSPESRKAVLSAVEKLNYHPSYFAKNIRTQKSMTIAFMIPDASNLFYTEMFKAIEKVALKQEYMVTLCDTQNSPKYELKYAEKLIQRKIDGLIYCTYKVDKTSQDYFTNLSKTLPIVFVDNFYRAVENISVVATEGLRSSRDAVKFLYHNGKRKIAYINFPVDAQVTAHRYEGYRRGLDACGLSFDESLVYFPGPIEEINVRSIGYYGAKELMSSCENIDAIMVAADPLAIGAMKYLKQQGIKIPSEVSIIGFDNSEICEIVEPNLTTIAQPINEIGTAAAKILLNKINGIHNAKERVFFEGELIQRDST
jgi:DNA-binding LacI/PurR family transcriptional regulator